MLFSRMYCHTSASVQKDMGLDVGRLASKALQPSWSQCWVRSLDSSAIVPMMGTRPVSWAYRFMGFFFISLQHSSLILNGAFIR